MALKRRMIGVREFMQMLDVKSRTTFDKVARANPNFPETFEWPPGTRTRGWRLDEAEAFAENRIENAVPWSEAAHNKDTKNS